MRTLGILCACISLAASSFVVGCLFKDSAQAKQITSIKMLGEVESTKVYKIVDDDERIVCYVIPKEYIVGGVTGGSISCLDY